MSISSSVWAQSRTYTTDADFNEGTLVNVNHDAPNNDQLQLNETTTTFPFINVAASNRGTVVRTNTETGEIIGEYRSAPQGYGLNPSRTTVDLFGNVWTGNRNEQGFLTDPVLGSVPHGSVVKIGLIIGGTRVDASSTPDPSGQYLAPPFGYNTCVDRDSDGLIKTSRGLGNILAWNSTTDHLGGADGIGDTDADGRGAGTVEDAEDECIVIFQRTPDADAVRHLSVDANNDVWTGGYPFAQRRFHKLDGSTGEIRDSFNARPFGCGGYGGLIDGNGVLWSASISQNRLLRYDTNTDTGSCIPNPQSYGLGIDTNGFIWNSTFNNNSVVKISPSGVIQPGFPKSTGGAIGDRGVAVTPSDNHVWIANSAGSNVSRLDSNGNVLKVISVGLTPTGVAVDAAGKVWVTNLNSNNIMRIDPNGGGDGLGTVDLTVNLGAGAGPYNYSDMTGVVAIGSTAPQGTWTVVHDGGSADLLWNTLSWNSDEPSGTGITGKVRAANTQAGLASEPFTTVLNGTDFSADGIQGRFVEIQMTLARNTSASASPVLFDATISAASAECLASDFDEVFNDADRRVEITIDDPEGIETVNFTDPSGNPLLINLSVQLIESSNSGGDVGFSRDDPTSDIDWSADDPGDRPTTVVMHLNQVDLNNPNAGYFLVTDNGCGTETVIDPPLEFDVSPALQFILEGGYPNPTRGPSTVSFVLDEAGPVMLAVYDVMGRKVATLVDQPMSAGPHEVRWNGRAASGAALASGVYLLRLQASNKTATRRMTVVK
ncbi:MAG: T9SS type A sorting domain-containing protein [Bacteroidetes bacterium]|nr:T9SS type A sorting domain-containing protein [Bacteroidota bacterium]